MIYLRFSIAIIPNTKGEKSIKRKSGKDLLSATEPFDNSPAGKICRNLMMAQSQYYSEELTEKIRRGMDFNAANGLSTGGGVALGYKIGKDKRFEVDPNTAPVVRKIYEMYAGGKTVTEITDYLNSLGLKTSREYAFNKNSLHTILKNKRYIGIFTYKGIETPGMMPRIVSDELFEKVAAVLEKNKKAPARAKAKEEYLLTTKLFCGHCKEMMTGFSGVGKQGKVYHDYICNGRKARPRTCNKKMVHKEYIESLVVSECRRLLSTENIRRIAAEVVAIGEAEKDTSVLKHLQKLMADNERKQKNTIDAIMESGIESVRKALGERLPVLEAEHRELEKQIAEEGKPYPTLTEEDVTFFLTQLRKGNINDVKYRKTLIFIFVNRIYLYDDRITITYNSGDEPVTISDILLSELEDREVENLAIYEKDRVLFLNGKGPL